LNKLLRPDKIKSVSGNPTLPRKWQQLYGSFAFRITLFIFRVKRHIVVRKYKKSIMTLLIYYFQAVT